MMAFVRRDIAGGRALQRRGSGFALLFALAASGAAAQTAPATVAPAPAAPAAAPAATATEVELPSGISGAVGSTSGIAVPGTGLTVTGLGLTASDYLFRGISQTRNTWAVQGALDVSHETGLYVGTFASNAKFLGSPWNDTRQEIDALAGYRFKIGSVNFDTGWIGYYYPGQQKAPGTQLNEYQEVAVKANYTIDQLKVMGAFNFSPNWFGHSGKGYYIEAGADLTLPWSITASTRIGRQWIERNAVFGTPDYNWYSVGFSREVYPDTGLIAAIGWYGTTIGRSQCMPIVDRAPGGQYACSSKAVFSLSKAF